MAAEDKTKEYEIIAAGKAAHEVTRKYAPKLCNCFVTDNVPIRLYSEHFIDQATFEKCANPAVVLSLTEKGELIFLDVQKTVSRRYDGISTLCLILKEELSELDSEPQGVAKTLEEAYASEYEKQLSIIKAQLPQSKELEKLRKQLEGFKITSQIPNFPEESLNSLIKRSLQNFAETSLNDGMHVRTLKQQLIELCEEDCLLSSQMLTWTIQEVDRISDGVKESSMGPFNMCVKPLNDSFIGEGTYAKVQIVIDDKQAKYAAKRYLRSRCKEFSSEFTLLAQLKHKNIVRYVGLAVPFRPDEHPAIVMELMDTDLHSRIISSQPAMTSSQKFKTLQDVAEGLQYLHSNSPKIIHRDLTARNVLLDSSGLAKISDFGNSRMISQELLTTLTSNVGTMVYLAPEALGNDYTEKIDIFSYGHLVLFILIWEFPSNLLPASYLDKDPGNGIYVPKVCLEVNRRERYLKILEEQTQYMPVTEIVKKCLSNGPEDRPSSSELLTFITTFVSKMNSS